MTTSKEKELPIREYSTCMEAIKSLDKDDSGEILGAYTQAFAKVLVERGYVEKEQSIATACFTLFLGAHYTNELLREQLQKK